MTIPRTPNVREPAGRGVPGKNDGTGIVDSENGEQGKVPRTSGAPERGKEPLPNPSADRNKGGIREAGTTPRPTGKPIVGGAR